MHIWQIYINNGNMRFKRYILLILLAGIVNACLAQRPHKFDPKRFEIEMRQFITIEAGLTPKEVSLFFPVFDELQNKQRVLFEKMRVYRFVDTSDDNASLKAIKEMDDVDLQIKELQKEYHRKFLKILPPGKVLKVLQADENFHRQAFKRMVKNPPRD